MKILGRLISMIRPADDDAVIDHVPVKIDGNVAAKKLARARKKAADRHGKPFHTHENKPRETERSPTLKALEAMSKPEPLIVVADNVARRQIGGAT